MKLRYACLGCEATVSTGVIVPPAAIPCPRCGRVAAFSAPPVEAGPIDRCLACGAPHLFLQKEFPRRVGLAIVVLGAAGFLVLMGFERLVLGFGTLGAVALIDMIIYRAAPLMTVCYRCQTEHRRIASHPDHGAWDPKIGFYTAKKAMAELEGSGGLAPHTEAPAGRKEGQVDLP